MLRRHALKLVGLVLVGAVALAIAFASTDACPTADLRTTLHVHVPHADFTPSYCASEQDACREADRVEGLTHSFVFEQSLEGRWWCAFAVPPGVIRTPACDPTALDFPEPTPSERDFGRRELHARVEGCFVMGLAAPEAGAPCGVLTQANALPIGSCGDAMFCRSSDSTCQLLPESCATDGDCLGVSVCDETHLCVRFVCDAEGAECVWPDECLDTSDCQRTHSRCDPLAGRCETFTCETGRCVGAQ